MTQTFNLEAYLLVFIRMVLGLTFCFSASGKALHMRLFIEAICKFRLLPSWSIRWMGYLFLMAEAIVVVFVVLGGYFLLPAFILAGGLLILFSGALVSVLVRKLTIACNCFGPSAAPVSVNDLVRNIMLVICAIAGPFLLKFSAGNASRFSPSELVLAGLWALVYTILSLNIGELFSLLRPPLQPLDPQSGK